MATKQNQATTPPPFFKNTHTQISLTNPLPIYEIPNSVSATTLTSSKNPITHSIKWKHQNSKQNHQNYIAEIKATYINMIIQQYKKKKIEKKRVTFLLLGEELVEFRVMREETEVRR